MMSVPYPPPGPYQGYPPRPPVKVPRPRTVKTLITWGVVLGALAVVSVVVGIVGLVLFSVSGRHGFQDGRLSVSLEADRVYEIKEKLPSNVPAYLGQCTVTGPEDAQETLTALTTSYASGSSREFTVYTFVTDAAGTYDFTCRHEDSRVRAGASFTLQPESRPTDPMIAGLPVAFFVLLPACLATLIPGLVQRSRLKRLRAMGLAPNDPAG